MYRSKYFNIVIAVLMLVFALTFQLHAAEEKTDTEKTDKEEKAEAAESAVAATVNGEPITWEEVIILYDVFEAKRPKSVILDELISKKAVEQFLDKEKTVVDQKLVDEEIEKIKKLYKTRGVDIQELLKKQNITEEEFRKQMAFQVRLRKYLESKATDDEIIEAMKRVRASHILISTSPDMTDDAAKKKIEEIEKELRKAKDLKEAFSEAAGKHSDCPSKSRGGDLGVFAREDVFVSIKSLLLAKRKFLADTFAIFPVQTLLFFFVSFSTSNPELNIVADNFSLTTSLKSLTKHLPLFSSAILPIS